MLLFFSTCFWISFEYLFIFKISESYGEVLETKFDWYCFVSMALVWLKLLKFVRRMRNLSNNPWKTRFFYINIEKYVFRPTQTLEWIGITWDSKLFLLKIPERRISDLLISIEHILIIFPNFTARQLAQVAGKLIALSPVLGNVTRLMTRCYYMVIETRITWDRNLCLTLIQEVLRELLFCRNNIRNINFRLLTNYSPPTVILYYYASNVACGAYSVEDMNNIFHMMWSENEKIKSSTWREMKAIEQALITFKEVYKYKNIKW